MNRPEGKSLQEVIDDLPKHVWDSGAEPPVIKALKGLIIEGQKHPLARKAVRVKRGKKAESNAEFIARVKAMSSTERMQHAIDAGIYNEDGTLTAKYGGKAGK